MLPNEKPGINSYQKAITKTEFKLNFKFSLLQFRSNPLNYFIILKLIKLTDLAKIII